MGIKGIVGGLGLFLLAGCGDSGQPAQAKPDAASKQPELLVYCGITMIDAMAELGKLVERDAKCKVVISKSGSGDLLEAIKVNRNGDLFLPGSESYIKQAEAQGLITRKTLVGFNRAAIVVASGNPKKVGRDPAALSDKSLRLLVANPESGSIGLEAKKVFQRRGVEKEVMANVMRLTADSKDITKAIISGEADVGINWYATTVWAENRGKVEAIVMDEAYAPRMRLLLAQLSSSKHPELAKLFLETASSPAGRGIFRKYGFYLEGESDE